MSQPGGIPASLARPLVERLGADCATASRVARLLLARRDLLLDETSFVRDGIRPGSLGAAHRAMAVFEGLGWCRREGATWRSLPNGMPRGTPEFLAGAAAMRDFGDPAVKAEAVVTLPDPPCLIAAVLPGVGLAHANLVGTRSAFVRVARRAVSTLTVMTPFLNGQGAEWALDVLAEAPPGAARHLVVRERARIMPLLAARRDRISALGVSLFDYWVPSAAGGGVHETFHAKVVLADDDVAYVGSANLTVYSQRSMELGALLEGTPVRALAAAVSAAKEIAHPFLL